MKTLNAVLIVKDEERCLIRCLSSVKGLVNKIIIADTGSGDRTKEIARSFGAEIYDFIWCNDFSAARNYALSQSHADWNLILDADEWVVDVSADTLSKFMEDDGRLGAIKIRNAYPDNGAVSYGINLTTRLVPAGIRFRGRIHEQVDSKLPRIPVPLTVGHDGYLQPQKEERNLPLLLEELNRHPDDPYYLFQTASVFRNMKKYTEALSYYESFINTVPENANYRCRGVTGYLYTLIELGSFEQGLKLIETEQEHLISYADFSFACGIFYMKLVLSDVKKYIACLPRIEASYLHCLEIGEVEEHGGVAGTGSFKAAYNLGTWYEVSGDAEKAGYYYNLAQRDRPD